VLNWNDVSGIKEIELKVADRTCPAIGSQYTFTKADVPESPSRFGDRILSFAVYAIIDFFILNRGRVFGYAAQDCYLIARFAAVM